MTLGNAAAAKVRLIVWCKGCCRQLEPDVTAMAATYDADIPVVDWRERLVCSQCGGRDAISLRPERGASAQKQTDDSHLITSTPRSGRPSSG
jgi:hypothetical protein